MTTPTKAAEVITVGQAAIRRAGEWTNREAALLGSAIAPGLKTDDLRVFAAICQHTGMDPFKRQIYAWSDKGRLTIHIGINGWRAIAARTGEYAGQAGPEWCGPDGQWRDVWLETGPPAAARVGVYRRGGSEPTWAVCTWVEFERTMKRKGSKGPTPWDEIGSHMLAVRAESHALQKACPEAYEAALTAMTQANVSVDVVTDEELPPVPEGLLVEPETGEILSEAEPSAPMLSGDVDAEWGKVPKLLKTAGIFPTALLGNGLLRAFTREAFGEWVVAGPGRDAASLVAGALEENMAAEQQEARR